MRIRAGFVTESTFELFFGAKFSIRTISSLRRQLPRKGSRGCLNGLANAIDEPLDHGGIFTFGHDADQGLGARLADEQPPLPFELGLGSGDALPDAVGLERLGPAVEADVLEQLRQR